LNARAIVGDRTTDTTEDDDGETLRDGFRARAAAAVARRVEAVAAALEGAEAVRARALLLLDAVPLPSAHTSSEALHRTLRLLLGALPPPPDTYRRRSVR
jgi:hypothetical protein